jgi:hypothetical protein
MGLKANVPIGVAIEGIKLAQGWILTLVAPSKATILQVYLRKLTSLEGFTEALDASWIDIGLFLSLALLIWLKSPRASQRVPGGGL